MLRGNAIRFRMETVKATSKNPEFYTSPQSTVAVDPAAVHLQALMSLVEASRKLAETPSNPTAGSCGVEADGQRLADQVVRAYLNKITRRIPKGGSKDEPGEQCPFTGFNRSQIYEILAVRKNGKPVVRNVTTKKKGEKHGARFYYVGSLMDWRDELAENQALETQTEKHHGKHS